MLKVYRSIAICLLIVYPILSDRFAIDLIKKFNSYRRGNFVISPLAVNHALVQLYLANQENVDMELQKVLYVKDNDRATIVKNFRDFYARAMSAEFQDSTRLYVSKKLRTASKYEQLIKRINASLESIDFGNKEKAILEMSMWLSQTMNRNYSTIMRESEVSSTTDLVSISGVSCKPNWKYPFFSRWKKPFKMRQAIGKPYVEYVNTMYTTANFATFDEKDARGIFIPLQRTSVGMLVIVPKKRGYPRKIMQNIGNYFNMKLKPEQKLSLFLPMFRIILGTELSGVLKTMGLKQLFEGFKYTEAFGSQEPLTVEKFKSKTVIEVNADRELIEIEDPAEEDDIIFEVNRPFVFLIKDRTRIYAAGRVNTLTNLVI